MNCAIYARVSTTDQNCEMQLRELREYVQRRGWAVFGEYVDTGFSGSKANRPSLDRLMKDARLRLFDCVLVWKLDRWGRSMTHLIDSLQVLAGLEIRWIAVTQNIDTDQANPMTRLVMHLMGAFAEFEREMIRERVKAGLIVANSKGHFGGRRPRVFDRQKVIDMRNEGKSVREISKLLGIGVGTVCRTTFNAVPQTPERRQPVSA